MRIAEIRVLPHEVKELYRDFLFTRVCETVSCALHRGYHCDEIPRSSLLFAETHKYVGECRNGGHAQYLVNTNRDIDALCRVSRFLEEIGRNDHKSIMDCFIGRFLENREAIDNHLEEKGLNDGFRAISPMFRDIVEKFFVLIRQTDDLMTTMRDWLLRQPWIIVDENALDIAGACNQIPPHPLKDQRGGGVWRGFI